MVAGVPTYSPRFDAALNMSARAHARQLRKGTDIPYLTHPVHVAFLLARHDAEEDVCIAALLHDLVEDTEVSLGEIERAFGGRVAAIVDGCSEPRGDYGLWEHRKEHTIESLRTAPADVRAVACADKLHNLSTIRDVLQLDGETVWDRFRRGRSDQAWYYRGLVDSLGQGWSHPLLDELRERVDEVFD